MEGSGHFEKIQGYIAALFNEAVEGDVGALAELRKIASNGHPYAQALIDEFKYPSEPPTGPKPSAPTIL